jgi:Tfp pilus assembly protein PilF
MSGGKRNRATRPPTRPSAISSTLYERYKDALRRGHVAALRGRNDAAIEAYQEAASIAPDRALPHASIGGILVKLNRPADAVAAYDRALALAPRDETALRGMAETLTRLGRRPAAADTLDRLAVTLEAGGRTADATDAARRALELVETPERRARVEQLTGRLRTASPGDEAAERALAQALKVLEPVEVEPVAAAVAGAAIVEIADEAANLGAEPSAASAESPAEDETAAGHESEAAPPEPTIEGQPTIEDFVPPALVGEEIAAEAIVADEADSVAGRADEISTEDVLAGEVGDADAVEAIAVEVVEPAEEIEPTGAIEAAEAAAPLEPVEAEEVAEPAEAAPVAGEPEAAAAEVPEPEPEPEPVPEPEPAPEPEPELEPEPEIREPLGLGIALGAAAEAHLAAGNLAEAHSGLLAAARAHRRADRLVAALDACYLAIGLAPSDPDLHLLMTEIYLDRGWRSQATDKLLLLSRLADLDGDPATHDRLCALVSARLADEPRLAELCA